MQAPIGLIQGEGGDHSSMQASVLNPTVHHVSVVDGVAEDQRPAGSYLRRMKGLPFSRSLGIGLVLELLLLVGLAWLAGHRRPVAPPRQPQRIAIHVVEPLPPAPLPRVPDLVPTTVVTTPTNIAPSLPVMAISRDVSLPHPMAFQVPALPRLPPPQTVVGNTRSVLARYTAMLNTAIQSGLTVPGMVRAMRLHGIATVIFELNPSGRLLWAKLERSSGIPPIDQAALAKVKSSRFPPFLKGLPRQTTTFQIAVKLSTTQ